MSNELKRWHEHIKNNPLNLIDLHKAVTAIFTPPDQLLGIPEFHKKILNIYDSEDRFVCVDAPVGFAKSSTIKSYMIRNILDCPSSSDGDKLQLYVSSTGSKVERQFSSFIRFFNSKDAQIFYNFKTIKANSETIAIRIHDEERRVYAISANSDISGINFENIRPSHIIIDDIEEIEQAKNIDRTDALKTWLKQTLISRFPSLREGKLRMIGTTLTSGAMITQIKRNQFPEIDWQYHSFPALDENNRSIWEEKEHTEDLLKKQAKDPITFAANYMNEPLDLSDSLLKEDDLRYYEYVNLDDFDELFLHADLTQSTKQTSDFYACGVLGMNKKDKNFYLLDFVLSQEKDPSKQATILINYYLKYKSKIGIDNITFDEKGYAAFGFWCKKEAKEKFNLSIPLMPLKYPSDKVTHFTPNLVHFKANRVYLPSSNPQVQQFTNQLLAFPSKSVHDDAVDLMSSLLDHFQQEEIIFPDIDEIPELNLVI
jgi:predicted phage terminase large subunit-like protein